ncbi:hypothetical protein M758_1G309000 [Ceratodon purpureus]|nr:hypothetical protein M758_1G309000 [Ceratodon purpureus]
MLWSLATASTTSTSTPPSILHCTALQVLSSRL